MDLALDPALPIAAHAAEIARLIEDHPVVVVAGETGSGKTTQLPKICLGLGRQRIGHTQPRRIAARTVAARVAEELGEPLGQSVGFQVRFAKTTGADTRLKVMTDGILLAEIGHDRQLRRYDTIIVDEAHERSLTIDFLLGYLKQLLAARADLKVIVTSATIDTARFAAHFDGAPVVEVSGRTYPVEIRYRPPGDEAAQAGDPVAGLLDAVAELCREGPGDILAFFSGEREIKDAARAIAGAFPELEVLPLFARLTPAEQGRVFTPHPGRRVILATNVAETSLTVPGVRYVIDPGTARVSRYSAKTKVQRLPIEPISRASADQRAGRCGRVAPGVCLRLYSEEDYAARPEFTEPEILRTNLASVILKMADARLGDIAAFPFVEAPDRGQVADGLRLLTELGALRQGKADRTDDIRLTRIGHQLAALPVDPRLARMVVEADKLACLKEVITLVAGLSVQDLRERPADQRATADALHARFASDELVAAVEPRGAPAGEPVEGGDFAALLRLWRYLKEQRSALGSNQFRRLCQREHLSFPRLREWTDLVGQLREAARDAGLRLNTRSAPLGDILEACLAGLLGNIGSLSEAGSAPAKGRRSGPREYQGTRGARFAISPGSVLAKTPPDLVMAVELLETTRLWAHTVAPIRPEWAERAGAHLVKRSYSEPRFVPESGTVVATEKTTVLGVTLVADRRVSFARVDLPQARAVFIQAALVEGLAQPAAGTPTAALQAHNAEVRQRVLDLEERSRRRDLMVDDAHLASFFEARLPADVVSVATLDRWLRHHPDAAAALRLRPEDVTRPEVSSADPVAYPDVWTFGPTGPQALTLSYAFTPGEERDGVTVDVPLARLAQLDEAPFTWGVPGQRADLATALIKTLPKPVRRHFAPAQRWAERATSWLEDHGHDDRPFAEELGRALEALSGLAVAGWDPAQLPSHLRPGFLVHDGSKKTWGKDLGQLQEQLVPRVAEKLAAVSDRPRRSGVTWVFGALPERVTVRDGAARAAAFPALRDDVAQVSEVLQPTLAAARRHHRAGLVRLLWFALPDPTRWCVAHLSRQETMALATGPHASVAELMAEARLAALAQLVDLTGDPWGVRDGAGFQALADAVRPESPERLRRLVGLAAQALRARAGLDQRLAAFAGTDLAADVRAQLDDLIFPGFLRVIPEPWLWRLPVYLQAVDRRLQAAAEDAGRDARRQAELEPVLEAYADLWRARPAGGDDLRRLGYLIEELRVQVFAQSLRTAEPVSAKRLLQAIAAAR